MLLSSTIAWLTLTKSVIKDSFSYSEEAGSSLQILIMTCHGERYRDQATYHAMV